MMSVSGYYYILEITVCSVAARLHSLLRHDAQDKKGGEYQFL